MSVQYYKPNPRMYRLDWMPVNLNKYRSKILTARKFDWLVENLCMRHPGDDMMFPAAVPWCELLGYTYEEWPGDEWQ